MLLYAKTDEDIYPENEYHMSGNKIAVTTLNLDTDFTKIKRQLNGIAESFFAVKNDLPVNWGGRNLHFQELRQNFLKLIKRIFPA